MSGVHTTKSFKSDKKDRPSHSAGGQGARKGGSGGSGAAGNWKDDIKYMGEDIHAVTLDDPNYDPTDVTEGTYDLDVVSEWQPAPSASEGFRTAAQTLQEFKRKVKQACDEFLVTSIKDEFFTCVRELECEIYHQDLPYILVKQSLDKTADEQQKVVQLLIGCAKAELLSVNQMTQGFRKVLNCMADITTDFPQAKPTVSGMLGSVRAAGCLLVGEAGEMEEQYEQLADPQASTALKAGKKRIQTFITEYFSSEDVVDFAQSVKTLSPVLHFEVAKKLVTMSLDQRNRERQAASVALAHLSGSAMSGSELEKAFSILLGRLEDLYLDVPDVLRLLSSFIARAVVDEALPPSFLVRQDLSPNDMGAGVLREAKALLAVPNAAFRMTGIWGDEFVAE